ncbi:DNA-binding protein VF530 [Maribacter sp. MJ134]|nr:DNA-binding protein VF530 [Maribacter sp. MJ134]
MVLRLSNNYTYYKLLKINILCFNLFPLIDSKVNFFKKNCF